MTEYQLLQAYRQNADQAAFRQIVATHINFVYCCAKRQLRDPQMADDVVQTVFLALAKRASALGPDVVLSSWLFIATRYAAADALRAARRRQHHEREAAQMANQTCQSDDQSSELLPHLNDGLAKLPRHERDAVMLRYMEGKSLRDTGSALRISEDAAAKRVSRAIERLRSFFRGRGVAVPSAAIATILAGNAAEAAPAALLDSTCALAAAHAAGAAVSAPMAMAADQLIRSMLLAKAASVGGVLVGLAAVIIVAGAVLFQRLGGGNFSQPASPAASSMTGDEVRKNWGPEWSNSRIAQGWPRALPGSVTGTPAIADLDGDGEPEIVVPCMARPWQPILHSKPTSAAMLYAFHRDGKLVKGWPVTLLDEPGRKADKAKRPGYADNWAASPTAADLDGDGKDEIIITAPPTHTFSINGDGSRRLFPAGIAGGEVWCSLPVIDLNGDGKLDMICNKVVLTADGKPVPGWKPSKEMFGFAPCVGDANGDGKNEIYYCEFRPGGVMHGLNQSGQEIPGWPQFVADQCLFPPVMGDVNGDGKMEIFACDGGGHVMGWQWNGRALLPGVSADGLTGVFKQGIQAYGASPALADLDGDGRAEVIVFDQASKAIRAWHGDGRGVFSPDGTVVRLPDVESGGAVTVASLGDRGIMDLFVSTYWIRVAKDGKTVVVNMLPKSQWVAGGCLITDIDRDGKAEIIFGTSDGQVFIYRTEKPYIPANMQWPTPNGNQRHTGVWRRS